MEQLAAWNNFYVIVGTAAATLTGLQFVVVALIAQRQIRGNPEATGVFSTPNIVHFCAALGVAALLCAPWPMLWQPNLLLGLAGLGGLLYMRIVMRRAQQQHIYTPVLEDLLFHIVFPLVAYSALVVAALGCVANATPALFIAGAATLFLLFIGIHNAWDSVTYLVIYRSSPEQPDQEEQAAPSVQ